MSVDGAAAPTIAARISWAIATGQLPPGTRLPSLRQGAQHWGTSVHTVRSAYQLLAGEGLIEITPQSSARVIRSDAERRPLDLDTMVRQLFDTAQRTLRASPEEVLAAVQHQLDWSTPAVTVLECSVTLAESLARQLRAHWKVRATGQCIDGSPVAPGPVLSTWFHRRELDALARSGRHRPVYLRIRPSQATRAQLGSWSRASDTRPIVLFETDQRLADNVVGEFATITGRPPQVVIIAPGEARSRVGAEAARANCLVSPRLWDALLPAEREHSGVGLLDYDIKPEDLEAIGRDQLWRPVSQRAG